MPSPTLQPNWASAILFHLVAACTTWAWIFLSGGVLGPQVDLLAHVGPAVGVFGADRLPAPEVPRAALVDGELVVGVEGEEARVLRVVGRRGFLRQRQHGFEFVPEVVRRRRLAGLPEIVLVEKR